jgi:putative DNA primase/helicase
LETSHEAVFSLLPVELTSRAQWVGWRCQPTRDGAPTKVPYNPRTGELASTIDPRTWTTFAEAVAAVPESDDAGGIGFVFSDDDPFAGVDLDGCRGPDGEIAPWAQAIIERLGSYTEVSPSGTGVHIVVRGALPDGARRRRVLGDAPGDGGKRPAIEIYDRARYFTVTGRHLPGTPRTVAERDAELKAVHAECVAAPPPANGKGSGREGTPRDDAASSAWSDAELIARAERAENGDKFRRLWAGDISGYGSHSEADLALCGILHFWTGGDAARIDRLFRQSGLMRPKWDEKHFAGGRTYGQVTIERARAAGGNTSAGASRTGRANDASTAGSGAATGAGDGTSAAGSAGPASEEPPPGPQTGASFPTTDYGNAQRLIARHGRDLRYCPSLGHWLVWDGRRWAVDITGKVTRRAKETVRSIYGEAEAAETAERRRELAAHAARSEAAARIRDLILLAQSEPGVPVTPDVLDADPWRLNVTNGTLDLRTGELRPHDREDGITRLVPVDYDPDAPCPVWEEVLTTILAGNERLIRFVQRAVGYTLTGDTGERMMFLLYGTGKNGKSTFLDTVRYTLADYAKRTPTETLLVKREGAIPNDVARLKGARMVYTAEGEEGRRLAEGFIKDATGGDVISARFLHGEWFEFRPEFKLWMATNHKPIIRGTDPAIWDRIRLIPFLVRIEKAIPRRVLMARLCAELPGILAWAVRGCLEWQRSGLDVPEEVAAATDAYRQEMDMVGRFLQEGCVFAPNARTGATVLYNAYKQWCEETGERTLTQQTFGTRLSERGLERKRGTGGKGGWWGIGLVDWHRSDRSDRHSEGSSHEAEPMSENPEVTVTTVTPGEPPPGETGGAGGMQVEFDLEEDVEIF